MQRPWPRAGLSAVALTGGALHAWALNAPWHAHWPASVQIISIALLAWAWHHATEYAITQNITPSTAVGRSAWLGWLYGAVATGGTCWWLYISMHRYGGLIAPVAALAVVLLAMGLGLFYALAGAVYGAMVARARPSRAKIAIIFIAIFALQEWLRGTVLTGFPWGAAGYAQVNGVLAAWAPWLGVYGMGALAAALGFGLAHIAHMGWRGRVLWGALLVGSMGLNWAAIDFTQPAGQLRVALLQGNIAQNEKFIPGGGVQDALNWYGTQLHAPSTADLIAAPETAVPMPIDQLPPGYWDDLTRRYATGQQAAVVGLPWREPAGYSNAAIALRPGAPDGWRYDKHHLVPFGEFVPWGFQAFVRMMHIPLGNFERGQVNAPSLAWRGQRIGINICYEDLFGEELAARFAGAPAADPTLLLNLSNIGWFGDTAAVDQHLNISRLRALELQRPMLRSTNTGATAIVDHQGRVTQMLAPHTRGVLTGNAEGRDGRTPYALWAAPWGQWPLVIVCLIALLYAGWPSRADARKT